MWRMPAYTVSNDPDTFNDMLNAEDMKHIKHTLIIFIFLVNTFGYVCMFMNKYCEFILCARRATYYRRTSTHSSANTHNTHDLLLLFNTKIYDSWRSYTGAERKRADDDDDGGG